MKLLLTALSVLLAADAKNLRSRSLLLAEPDIVGIEVNPSEADSIPCIRKKGFFTLRIEPSTSAVAGGDFLENVRDALVTPGPKNPLLQLKTDSDIFVPVMEKGGKSPNGGGGPRCDYDDDVGGGVVVCKFEASGLDSGDTTVGLHFDGIAITDLDLAPVSVAEKGGKCSP